jgi:ATP-grasp domain
MHDDSLRSYSPRSLTLMLSILTLAVTSLAPVLVAPQNHVNNPHVHYHLAGKDALALMTPKTTRLLANTQDERPCVAKVTHAMGSKGIFVIRTNDDEAEFKAFLQESGNPTFVVTEFVEITRNIACHFYIHPDPSKGITWFGSNENVILPDGDWSTDSTIIMSEQETLKELQMPFVEDVVAYCRALGFWGFCGIDVLIDSTGKGYVVDVNPRVTGTCPALMIAQKLQDKYGFSHALFRRNSSFAFVGNADELLAKTSAYNEAHEGHSRIVLHSFYEKNPQLTLLNIAVYGMSLADCQVVLDEFAPPMDSDDE